MTDDPQASSAAPAEDSDSVGFGAGSFVAVPIPVNDPTFGTGLVLGGGYLFKADEGSNTSFIGGGVFGTNEGSRAGGIGGSFSFDDKRYNLFGFLGAADVSYDLFILGEPVRIEQQGVAFQGQFRYGFSDTLSAGVSLRYLESQLSGVNGTELPEQIQDLTDISIATVGIVGQWDTRDNTFYPTAGSFLDFEVTYNEQSGGRNLTYTRSTIGYDHFWSLGERSVIAARVAGCGVQDKAPFFDTCLLGSEIRGFSLFEFYGDQMVAAQAEYRGRFNERFGYVAFAGLGDVRRNILSLSLDSGTRYAGGVGGRLRVSKEFDLDVSLDVTYNDKDESYVYFYVGQSF
ncbi:BamA/TamA family outer membrane protein [Palleronia sp. KMU-117]|uniref:BamA/TamA family outer membrane protein n=1 Tax=Palleronia sp. KMU-117 TaxID=3434108 RepID=UPI003D765CFE